MESIIQSEKKCLLCDTTRNLEEHHIVFGTANRELSEKYGLKVHLCAKHHRGGFSPHHNKALDDDLKKLAQMRFEEQFGVNLDFKDIFGINYLGGEDDDQI